MNLTQKETMNALISTTRWQISTLQTKFVETGDFFWYARANTYKRKLFMLVGEL